MNSYIFQVLLNGYILNGAARNRTGFNGTQNRKDPSTPRPHIQHYHDHAVKDFVRIPNAPATILNHNPPTTTDGRKRTDPIPDTESDFGVRNRTQ